MNAALYITDYGALLPTGNHPGALLAAVLAGQTCTRMEDTLMVPASRGAAMPVTARLPAPLPGLLDLTLRLLASWQDAPVLLVLPDPAQRQHHSLFTTLKPAVHAHCHLTTPRQLPDALAWQAQRLHTGEHTCLTVLAVDDLLTRDCLLALNQSGALRTDQHPLGRAPAQGLAWFQLTAAKSDTDTNIAWRGLHANEEPNHNQIGSAPLHGLAHCLKQCLEDESTPARPEVVVHARAQTQAEQLEWYHARQQVWPDDRQQPAMELLCPALTHGDLGAASLAAAVVLACERLRFALKPATDALVIDTTEQGGRLALTLSRSATRSP